MAEVCMTIVESGQNRLGVASGCSKQEVDVASGWNLWVWLECIGVVSGGCCKEVYRFPHNITYPYTPLVLALFCSSIPTSLFIFNFFGSCLCDFCAV